MITAKGQKMFEKDCNAAVIPKEEILDAIYHCYQDKWLPLSIGEGGNEGVDDCALCLLGDSYRKNSCVGCAIYADSGRCENSGSLYREYIQAVKGHDTQSLSARCVARRFAHYLLDLYARVNQDKVNLPYLAPKHWAKAAEKTAGKPEPVEKKKEWKLVDNKRVEVKTHRSDVIRNGVSVYVYVDGKQVGTFKNEGGAYIARENIKFSFNESRDNGTPYYNTFFIYEYI